ncbi:hypothetical protein Golomagni_00370 [Golovinomyces magnicellulatus]|nr:hypothetical protein Golomagni_00370 [Golovinomyces magnicellulatus]
MVIFLNLEEPADHPDQHHHHWPTTSNPEVKALINNIEIKENVVPMDMDDQRKNINREKSILMALGCYPIVKEIASHLDLNSLDALSSSCRQARVNLLQFRVQLISSTLHCENQRVKIGHEQVLTNIGASNCARDLVGPCQKCNRVVCRNCAMKPTASNTLRYRHRRICSTCSNLDLMTLISPTLKTLSSENDNASESHGLKSTKVDKDIKPNICKCSSVQLWLCKACAQKIRNADTEYQSIWRWSVRFLPSLGGLGIGLGEADRGVSCGRGENCARAREVKLEIDCDAEDAREINDKNSRLNFGPILCSPNGQSHGQMRPGYHRHEIEGIGGVLKKKLVKMVKVGACVSSSGSSNDTWSDGRNLSDKDMENILEGEIQGTSRSWCSWCQKIIPSHDDNNNIYSEPISIVTDQ